MARRCQLSTVFYLTGGILPKILPVTGFAPFLDGYQQLPFANQLGRQPDVRLITLDQPGLRGALEFCLRQNRPGLS